MKAESGHRSQLEEALARIHDPGGQGARTFLRLYEDSARIAADAADAMAKRQVEPLPLAGVTVSIKDLFDVEGDVTAAGSVVLKDTAPAEKDAEVVARLRRAGAAIVGRTNMTEFAFSGLGLNPHYGTPLNCWERWNERMPGGSSSGAAISVTDKMAELAIGTDTGGSCRIPAALNGVVGMKPTANTIPTNGTLPLSSSFDSVGSIARDVQTCARAYNVLSASVPMEGQWVGERLVIGVIKNYVLDDLDPTVSLAYEKALDCLSKAGVALCDVTLPVLDELPALFANGGIVAAEAYEWHQGLLADCGDRYDPRVAVRIRRGSTTSAADYIRMIRRRRKLIAEFAHQVADFNCVLMPTVPLVAPRIAEVVSEDAYTRINLLMLRNPTLVNVLDGCAISVPCNEPSAAPVGLTVAATGGSDWQLIDVAFRIEAMFRSEQA